MFSEAGLFVHCLRLDGRGGAEALDPNDDASAQATPCWIHLDRGNERACGWMEESAGLPDHVVEALLAEETRPRVTPIGSGLVVLLRGVNHNPGSDPEDMVSLRIWVDSQRIVTLRKRRLLAVVDTRESLLAGHGPVSPADVLVGLAKRLIERMEPALAELDDAVTALEDEIVDTPVPELRGRLGTLRRQAIAYRRYLAPQREVLARLATEQLSPLGGEHRLRLRETTDRVIRYVEDLDESREQAAVLHEELTTRSTERMDRTMYVMSMIATVFLPLGFVTGLLGINVGGIPGSDSPVAFWEVVGALGVLAVLQGWALRRWFL